MKKVTRHDKLTVYALEQPNGDLWGPSSGAAGRSLGRWFTDPVRAFTEKKRYHFRDAKVIEGTITWQREVEQ